MRNVIFGRGGVKHMHKQNMNSMMFGRNILKHAKQQLQLLNSFPDSIANDNVLNSQNGNGKVKQISRLKYKF
jgi:hypothetical protein